MKKWHASRNPNYNYMWFKILFWHRFWIASEYELLHNRHIIKSDFLLWCYLRNNMEEEANLTEPWRKIRSINYHFVKPLIISHQLVSNSCITLSQWRLLRGIIFRIHTIFRRALVYEDLCDSGQVMTHMNPHFRRKMLLVNFPFG